MSLQRLGLGSSSVSRLQLTACRNQPGCGGARLCPSVNNVGKIPPYACLPACLPADYAQELERWQEAYCQATAPAAKHSHLNVSSRPPLAWREAQQPCEGQVPSRGPAAAAAAAAGRAAAGGAGLGSASMSTSDDGRGSSAVGAAGEHGEVPMAAPGAELGPDASDAAVHSIAGYSPPPPIAICYSSL
jgi:hypothetical protein